MNFSITRPQVFYLFIPVILALVFELVRYKKIKSELTESKTISRQVKSFVKFRRNFALRTFFRTLAAVFVILACAGIYWGVRSVPVQKTGRAVAMVFDISYSMEARDCPDGMTRMQASAKYAQEILEHIDGTRVSVILAKGNGITAVPLTEDYESVNAVLNNLSPKLMTSKGTSLGSGIKAAISSFPEQSSEASYIWLFTDGEETDDSLTAAINEANRYGYPVSIIGFGSEHETEVFAGDGKTKIKTALRSNIIEKVMSQIRKKQGHSKMVGAAPTVMYVDSTEVGSAYNLMKSLYLENDGVVISYETQLLSRSHIFILLAIISFALSYFFGELDVIRGRKNLISSIETLLLVGIVFTGCSDSATYGKKILDGKLSWNSRDYQQAVADFLEVKNQAQEEGNVQIADYALFGLATTYLMQNEIDAAAERYSQISPEASPSIKFAVYYNMGIIAHRRGDYTGAAELFKQALLLDSTNTNAKINMELSLIENSFQSEKSLNELIPLSENHDDKNLQEALYSIIRENEGTQWKNQQTNSENTSDDY